MSAGTTDSVHRVNFTLVREVAAPPETVFDVLTDHRGYVDITPFRKIELERVGDPAPNGVGAIRVMHAVGPPHREEVISYEPPSHFSYRLISGAPLRDHVGDVTLEPAGEGTKVTYTVSITPTLPVGKVVVVVVVKLAVRYLLNAIAGESERRAATAV